MKLMSPPTYYKYPELNAGDILVEKGMYVETTEGKFGDQHHFEEVETGERKCLNSAGQLDYCVKRIKEGTICKVVFKGKQEIKSGAMAGKMANSFDFFTDEPVKKEPVNKVEVSSNLDDLE